MNRSRPAMAAAALTCALMTNPGQAEPVWVTNPDIPTGYSAYLVGPSVASPVLSGEVADDFNVIGLIDRIVADGVTCNNGCSGAPDCLGVTVRFYDWTPDGPGALQVEHFVPVDTGDFFWTPSCCLRLLDITLPEPFVASGWHYVSVQAALTGSASTDQWNFYRSNVGDPMGGAAHYRDLNENDEWIAFHTTTGFPPSDTSFELHGEFTGTPTADILTVTSPMTITPSARIRIDGDAFGDEQAGQSVVVNGAPAFITQWTDDTIIAYVPESTAPGAATVAIMLGDDVLDEETIDVAPRLPDGRVRWRFSTDSWYMLHAPGLGSDGQIYINDLWGKLYALDADGGLQWIVDALRGQPGGSSDGPVVVGDDGAIYVTVNPLGPTVDFLAYEPDGTLRWAFTDPDALGVAAGPAVGPDGNVYIVFHDTDLTSFGAASFTPQGDLRWTNNGAPAILEYGGVGAELAFTGGGPGDPADRLIFTVDRDDDRRVYAFDLASGEQIWQTPAGVLDVGAQTQAIADNGRAFMGEFTGPGGLGWGLQSFDAANGARQWRFDPGIAAYLTNPSVGPDGVVYTTWDGLRMSAVDPATGSELWRYIDPVGNFGATAVSPANDVIVSWLGQGGAPSTLIGVSTAGERVWTLDLGPENGGSLVVDRAATFTPDGSTAYIPVSIPDDALPFSYGYLYAIDPRVDPPNAADLDGDGDVDAADLALLLGAWGPCGRCGSDLNADGQVDAADLALLLGAWS